MEPKKILIIEDLPATQQQLSEYYDKQGTQYEICKNFAWAYEKIIDIVDKKKLWEYEYILMDGNLNGSNTDKFIEHLLWEESVPPIISISWITQHSDKYKLPYADKLGIIENLEFILWKSDEVFLDSHIWVMEWYKNRFDNRERNIITRKALLEVFQQESNNTTPANIITPTQKESTLQKIISKFTRKQK